MTSTIATRPVIDTTNLTEEQLIAFRDCVVAEAQHDFDYLLESLLSAARTHAVQLLAQQGVDATDDDLVDEISGNLLDLVHVQVSFKGLNDDRA